VPRASCLISCLVPRASCRMTNQSGDAAPCSASCAQGEKDYFKARIMQTLMPQTDMPADADDRGGVNNLHRAPDATHTPDEAARPTPRSCFTPRSSLPAKVLVRYDGDDTCDEWIDVNSGRLRAPQGWGTRIRHCCEEHVHTCHEHAHACEDEDRSLEVAPAGLFGSCNGRYWQVKRPEGAPEEHERAVARIKTTLIVCPTHIGEQWHQEILRHTQANAVKVLCYHGLKAPPKDAAPVSLEEVASADIGPSPLPSSRDGRAHFTLLNQCPRSMS
jgi:hypothetical protein